MTSLFQRLNSALAKAKHSLSASEAQQETINLWNKLKLTHGKDRAGLEKSALSLIEEFTKKADRQQLGLKRFWVTQQVSI